MIAPVAAHFHGTLLRRTSGPLSGPLAELCHWVRIPLTEGQLYRLTGLAPLPAGLARYAEALLAAPDGAELSGGLRPETRRDPDRRAARRRGGGRLVPGPGCRLDAGRGRVDPAAGRAGGGRGARPAARRAGCTTSPPPRGRVSAPASASPAMRSGTRWSPTGCGTTAEIGVVLGAGTNCGSCIPELEEILRDVRMPAS